MISPVNRASPLNNFDYFAEHGHANEAKKKREKTAIKIDSVYHKPENMRFLRTICKCRLDGEILFPPYWFECTGLQAITFQKIPRIVNQCLIYKKRLILNIDHACRAISVILPR